MKSISEILGGAQILLGVAYDPQDSFEEYLNTDHRAFLEMLRVVEEYLPPLERTGTGLGRPAYENVPFFRAFLGMSFFRIASIDALRNRPRTDPNLRQICGFSVVPSLATFSRRFAEFVALPLATCTLNDMVSQYHKGRSSAISRAIRPLLRRGRNRSTRNEMSTFRPGPPISGAAPGKGKRVQPKNQAAWSSRSGWSLGRRLRNSTPTVRGAVRRIARAMSVFGKATNYILMSPIWASL